MNQIIISYCMCFKYRMLLLKIVNYFYYSYYYLNLLMGVNYLWNKIELYLLIYVF